jgi:hypothetical protein
VGQAVVAGSKATVERLANMKAAPRPEVARAFAAAGNTAVQGLLVPPAALARAIEETMPALPPQAGGGATKTFTRGVEWLALGIDITPQLNAQVVIQSPDADAAKVLNLGLPTMLQALAKDKGVQAVVPTIGKLAAGLKPRVTNDRVAIVLEEEDLAGLLRPFFAQVKQAGQTRSMNVLRQIGLSMHVYHDSYNTLPTQANYDKQNKPLLSWRVHLLPFMEQGGLYEEFRLNEPWDSDHNKKLIPRMPKIYQGMNAALNEAGKTTFVALLGEGTVFGRGDKKLTLGDVANADGTSNTIAVVEADDDQAVIWTKPDDLTIDKAKPRQGLGSRYDGSFLALFLDGSVSAIPRTAEAGNVYLLFLYKSGKAKQRP